MSDNAVLITFCICLAVVLIVALAAFACIEIFRPCGNDKDDDDEEGD